MSTQSIKNRIKSYLQEHEGWVHGGEIEGLKDELNAKAGTINRRARELAESGKIDRKTNDNGEVEYRSLQEKKEVVI